MTRAFDAMDRSHGIDGDGQHESRMERESGERCGGNSRQRSAGRERAGQDSGRTERELDRGPCDAGGSGREPEHEKAAGPKPPDVELGMSLPLPASSQRRRRLAGTAATHAAPARRSRAPGRPLTRRRRGGRRSVSPGESRNCWCRDVGPRRRQKTRNCFESNKVPIDPSVGSCRRLGLNGSKVLGWRVVAHAGRSTDSSASIRRWDSGTVEVGGGD